ncbi:hypothetical protein PWT90_08533 [Aphanocladium album]|nr:hypothetical protein PWT90_08533 [Aphanocladium album]
MYPPPPPPPNKPSNDLLPFSPSTPQSGRNGQNQPLPPGTMIRYTWTCHECGCGTFLCNKDSVAECVHCSHAICDGCTTAFGASLLKCVEITDRPLQQAPNPGCTCEWSSKVTRCRSHHPIRRCPGLRRLRHAPYARPTFVQHYIVTLRPGRDGCPGLGTFLSTRPRYEEVLAPSRARVRALSAAAAAAASTTGDETLDCIANSVAAARRRAVTVIPPIFDMFTPAPRAGDPATVRRGIPVSTVALARFFATGASSAARAVGMSRPVVCVHVDPLLSFVAYYLCASFYAVFAVWYDMLDRQRRRRGQGSQQQQQQRARE